MIEFKTEPQKTFRPIILVITLAVLAVLMGGVALYIHYQKGLPSQPGGSLITVPGVLRAGNTDFEFYKTRIHFEHVKGTLGISLNGIRTATVAGTIVNDGDRTLEALELHVILYDSWGRVSKDKTAFAFRPGQYRYEPLSPMGRRGFSISIEDVEYYWDPQNIDLEITGLKYQ
jgi:hypothetical protein